VPGSWIPLKFTAEVGAVAEDLLRGAPDVHGMLNDRQTATRAQAV
jgi:hypothetical protein